MTRATTGDREFERQKALALAAIREEVTLAEATPGVIRAVIPEAVGGAVILIPVVEVPLEGQDMGSRTSKMIRKSSHSFVLRSCSRSI
jgi:hypothetical protein